MHDPPGQPLPALSLGRALADGTVLLKGERSNRQESYSTAPQPAVISATKRAAYELPDGAELLLGGVKTSFQCPAKNGYFADVDNACLIFHVCNVVPKDDGSTEVQQYSFLCGNQTVFNQLSLTCAFAEEAVPCNNAPDFFYVNDNIGNPTAPFLTEADVQKAAPLIPGFGAGGGAGAQQPGRRPF
ncbi:hypothetical protein HPB49_022898 [Dermacentor silvarum]|uniref:Uncharacterized protein n=1 Tax=Dermacentor silvarum TaxID=543639 RepID=A0ACB8E3V7_DERSI|nr:hypothetical protein HPB49_022898 [Dermacentor silvarum]